MDNVSGRLTTSNSPLASSIQTLVDTPLNHTESAYGGLIANPSQLTSDSVSIGNSLIEAASGITAQQIADKLAELFNKDSKTGSANFSPDENTPEKAANRVLDGLKSLFQTYKKQNSSEDASVVEERFIKIAKQGVQDGYSSALDTLDKLGAFGFNGVKDTAEKTKILIDTGLDSFIRTKSAESK